MNVRFQDHCYHLTNDRCCVLQWGEGGIRYRNLVKESFNYEIFWINTEDYSCNSIRTEAAGWWQSCLKVQHISANLSVHLYLFPKDELLIGQLYQSTLYNRIRQQSIIHSFTTHQIIEGLGTVEERPSSDLGVVPFMVLPTYFTAQTQKVVLNLHYINSYWPTEPSQKFLQKPN